MISHLWTAPTWQVYLVGDGQTRLFLLELLYLGLVLHHTLHHFLHPGKKEVSWICCDKDWEFLSGCAPYRAHSTAARSTSRSTRDICSHAISSLHGTKTHLYINSLHCWNLIHFNVIGTDMISYRINNSIVCEQIDKPDYRMFQTCLISEEYSYKLINQELGCRYISGGHKTVYTCLDDKYILYFKFQKRLEFLVPVQRSDN